MLNRLIFGLSFSLAAIAQPVFAHPPAILSPADERAIAEDIAEFRKALAAAIVAKDAGKLREMYAASFVHTHGSGKVDGRDARIVSALAGDPVIENAPVEDLVIRAPSDWTAVATSISPIRSPPTARPIPSAGRRSMSGRKRAGRWRPRRRRGWSR